MILEFISSSIKRWGNSRGLALVLALAFTASCVGGPDAKKDASPAQPLPTTAESAQPAPSATAQPSQPAQQVHAAQSEKSGARPKLDFVPPPQEAALIAPVSSMPPVPGERAEADMLADADRRSEFIKPQIQAGIAAVVPGPYPEVKKPEKEAAPAPRDPGSVKTAVVPVASAPVTAPAVAAPQKPTKQPAKGSVAPQFPTAAQPQATEKPAPEVPEPTTSRAEPAVAVQVEGVPDLDLVKKFTVADGLPINLISALYVDETEAWVGTAGGGIARYVFSESHWIITGTTGGLASDFVTDVVKYKGKVFVGTKAGISIWDGFDWSSMSELEQVQLANVTFALKEGELWAAARNMRGGVLSYDGNKWVDRSTMRQGLILNNVSDFVFDGSDIWLGTTSRGVYVKRGKEWKIFSVTDGIASNFIYTMAVKGGKCYLGGCCGVSYYDGEKWTIFDVPEGLPHSTVNSIVWDASGLVWLGSKNGLAGFDGTAFRNFYVDDGLLPDNHVTALFVKGADVWVGTVGGLSHLQKSQ